MRKRSDGSANQPCARALFPPQQVVRHEARVKEVSGDRSGRVDGLGKLEVDVEGVDESGPRRVKRSDGAVLGAQA